MKEKKSKIFIVSSAIIVLLAIILIVICQMPAYREKERKAEAILQFATSSYDCVFLSMFPTDTFHAEDFLTYEARTIAMPDITIPDYETMYSFFQYLKEYKHEIKEMYLGLSPDRITAEQAESLVQMFPDTLFKVFPEWLPLKEWQSAKDADALTAKYQDMVYAMTHQPNALVYPFFSHEWIIADDTNYLKGSLLKEDVALRTYLLSLIGPEEAAHSFYARPDRVDELFAEFRAFLSVAETGEYFFPDLSDLEVVFLGDSIFGNYNDRRSIPGYVSNLSGAETYNLGWGGATASDRDGICLRPVLNALLSQDPSFLPKDSQAYAGLTKYLLQARKSDKSRRLIFVLHFGINDYFEGVPISSDHPTDASTFSGALKNVVDQLQSAFPDAQVCLVVPNPIFAFQNGTEVINTAEGTTYADYAQSILDLARKEGLSCLDNYHDSHLEKTQWLYYADDIHPNDYGRYKIAYALMQLLATVSP